MPIKEITTPYPLIDADPHFSRVVRYMRPSDAACVAGGTALAPALLYAWGTTILNTAFDLPYFSV